MADFHEGLCEVLNNTLRQATFEVNRLRAENKELRQELAERDPDIWALAEQVQSLQVQLDSVIAATSTRSDK